MNSCSPQPVAPLNRPDPPTQTRPNHLGTKVHRMTTRSNTHRLKPRQFLTTPTLSPKIPITHKKAKLIPQWNSSIPVIKTATVRLVLTITTQLDWHVHQLDVKNAFSQGRLT
uniref:Reverse transcriptase Ty1/copia-type domain-containing protein n=1 Tax=Solanum lycopersicum TaxID=4081 RepID=A0A3Q7GI88_SOLLC